MSRKTPGRNQTMANFRAAPWGVPPAAPDPLTSR
nr:MAG TPA: hypothetical protein [Caudoviricetes sp.]